VTVRALLADYRFAVGPTVLSTAASGLAAATTLLVARQVGADQFGGYTVVLTVGGILLVLAQLSLNVVLYQELPRRPAAGHPALVSTALATGLVLAAVVTAAVAAAAPALRAVFGIDSATLAWSMLFALSTGFGFLVEGVLRGRAQFRRVAALRLAAAVAYLLAAAGCLLVLHRGGFGTYVALLAASNVAFGLAALVGQPVRARLVSVPLARRLLVHGGHVSVTAALVLVVFGVDVIVLNHTVPPDVVGQYSVYNGFPKRLLGILFTEGVGLVLLPTLAPLAKPELLRRVGRVAPLLGLAAAAVGLAGGAVLFGLLGAGYPFSPGLLALAALGIGVHTVFNLYYLVLTVDGTRGARVAAGCLLAGLPVAVGAQVLLIGRYGLAGGLAAFVVTNAVLLGLILAATARVYRSPACTSPT
jgi:O-antigen/teichoic acid export membrane protein